MRAERALYALLYESMILGYTISHKKSTLAPVQRLVHLGYGIDNAIGSYFITDKLRAKFRLLRDRLLTTRQATLHDIQSFVGKCNHLRLVFQAASLFTFRCRELIPSLSDALSPLSDAVIEEISFWTFVDSFSAPIPFRLQQHLSLRLSTDASGYAWGALVSLPTGPVVLRDYWTADLMPKDICVKEALAVLLALESVADSL